MAIHPSLLQQFALMRLFPADALASLATLQVIKIHQLPNARQRPLKSRNMTIRFNQSHKSG
jgi:hypothetical protein